MKMRHITVNLFLLFAFVLVAVSGNGQAIEVQPVADQKKMALTLKKASNNMKVRILDEAGHYLVNQPITRADMPGKVFNLEKLRNGTYKLIVTGENMETEQDFAVTNQGVEIKTEPITFYTPSFRYNDQMLDISFMNQSAEAVSISIRNNKGDVVYQDEIKEMRLLEKRYNLDGLATGEYQVVFQTPRKSYYKDLTINK